MLKFKKLVLLLATSFLLTHSVIAKDFETNNYPTYQDGKLIIPRVDTSDQIGNFQNAVYQFDEQTDTWRLQDFITAISSSLIINKVELSITESFPVQVFLKIYGDFTNGCEKPGQVNQKLDGNKFEMYIHADHSPRPPGTSCTTSLVPFETLVPLSVYGLSAGNYEYSVNGGDVGTFTLAEDNKL